MAGSARRALLGLTAALAVVSGSIVSKAQSQARQFQRPDLAGPFRSAYIPRALDRTPITVMAILAGPSVADEQDAAGRRLTRQEKNTIKAQRRAEQAAARGAIEGAGGRVVATLQSALNGVKVRIPIGQVGALRQIPGVVDVKPVVRYEMDTTIGVPRIGAPFAWSGVAGVRGEHIKVGIIDSGIDYTHANFQGPGTSAAYQAALLVDAQPADPALFGPGAPRVKGGTDLVGDNYDAGSDDPARSTPVPDPNPLDCNGH